MFNPRHLDDFDDFCDFDEKLETSLDDLDPMEENQNSQYAWRKPLLQKALANVRKIQEVKSDVKNTYQKGELLFDEESSKFGRVTESKPGFLSLALISGGKVLKQIEEPISLPKPQTKPIIAVVKAAPKKEVKKVLKEKPIVKKVIRKEKTIVAKIKTKTIEKKKIIPKKIKAKKPTSFTSLLPKGATTDPIRDPNGYIQQNFLLMNNKELAKATGLSEHTVRRKLGEWGLKRKDGK